MFGSIPRVEQSDFLNQVWKSISAASAKAMRWTRPRIEFGDVAFETLYCTEDIAASVPWETVPSQAEAGWLESVIPGSRKSVWRRFGSRIGRWEPPRPRFNTWSMRAESWDTFLIRERAGRPKVWRRLLC